MSSKCEAAHRSGAIHMQKLPDHRSLQNGHLSCQGHMLPLTPFPAWQQQLQILFPKGKASEWWPLSARACDAHPTAWWWGLSWVWADLAVCPGHSLGLDLVDMWGYSGRTGRLGQHVGDQLCLNLKLERPCRTVQGLQGAATGGGVSLGQCAWGSEQCCVCRAGSQPRGKD